MPYKDVQNEMCHSGWTDQMKQQQCNTSVVHHQGGTYCIQVGLCNIRLLVTTDIR